MELSPEVAQILARFEEEQERQLQQPALEPLEPPKAPAGPRAYIRRSHGIETLCIGKRGPRMIHGIASTPTINTKRRSVDPAGCQVKFPIPLLCSHEELGQVGEVVLVSKEPNRVIVHGMFWDTLAANYAWDNLILTGEMRCLSVGSTSIRKTVVDGVTFYERWLLREVSIVRNPANPDCYLEVMP